MKYIILIYICLIGYFFSNKTILMYDNKLFYFNNYDLNVCEKITIGVPENGYRRSQNLKIFYRSGEIIDFSQPDYLLRLHNKYEFTYINRNMEGRNIGEYKIYKDRFVCTSDFSGIPFMPISIILKENRLYSIDIKDCNPFSDVYDKVTNERHKEPFPDDRFIIGIKIDDTYIPFPIFKKDIMKVIGKPDKEINYSQRL